MKKKIPFEVVSKIQPLIDKYRDVVKYKLDESIIIRFEDLDPESNFYFQVYHQNQDGKHLIKYRPNSELSISENSLEASLDSTIQTFEYWVSILIKYNNFQSVFDDPAQKSYQQYYYDNYQIVDEDAEYAPFDPPRILYLEEHLEAVKEFIEKNVDLFKDSADAESIKASCDELIEELTVSPKNTVMKRLTSIWAKISKGGTKLMKKFLTDFGSELKKKLIEDGVTTITKYLSDHGDDIIDTISNTIQ